MLEQTETQTGPDSSICFPLSPEEISEQFRSSMTILSPLVTYKVIHPAMLWSDQLLRSEIIQAQNGHIGPRPLNIYLLLAKWVEKKNKNRHSLWRE